MNKTIIISFFFCISIYSFSQVNVSIDRDCLDYNAAIISKAMLVTFGEDSIRHLLDNNIYIVFSPQVDSLGRTLKINKIRSKWSITNDFVNSIETYLITNKIHFYICFANDPPDKQLSHTIDYAREYFKKNKSISIAFGFPGELMNLYEYEKEKVSKEGHCLSKYDYLLMQINKYTLE